jgi:Mg-chelatase subunit ChlD
VDDLDRWRLVLGRYAHEQLGESAGEEEQRREEALDFLYQREYAGRDVRGDDPLSDDGPGLPELVGWLDGVRELFPASTAEVVERHALERYGLVELIGDPDVLARLEPSPALLATVLALREHLAPEVLDVVRELVRTVVEELTEQLQMDVRRALTGRLSQHRHSPMKVAANFDPRGTIRRNLRHVDPRTRQMVLADVRFFERNARHLPWDVVLCVDQSGSMYSSVVHSAVMASILSALPAFRVRLVVFDTEVVDLTPIADDPVETLMSVSLGGGTDIARAVTYCAGLVENPARTVLVLVTDFQEGGSRRDLVRQVKRLAESRVRLLGLAALDKDAKPSYDREMAARLAACGMEIAALTPDKLAAWLTEVTS